MRIVNLRQRVCDARVQWNTWPDVAAGEDWLKEAGAATSAINFYE